MTAQLSNDESQSKMMENADRYARSGIAVLPLYPIRRGVCACGGACQGRSAGKHPIAALCPHGVRNATTAPEIVAAWWHAWPDANIGLALGEASSGLCVFDVDNSPIAARLLEFFKSEAAPQGFAVVTTGRGIHVYFRSEADTRTAIVYAANGSRIGELRATGAYMVAPPSLHVSGATYRFIYGALTC